MVWDVSAETDPLLYTSRISDYSHREPITQLDWVYDQKEKAMQLASLATDGKLLLWTTANRLDSPIIGFHIAAINPQRLRSEYKSGSVTAIPGLKDNILGGTALSFFPENRGEVVIGTENGTVMKCGFPTHDEDSQERPPDLPEAKEKKIKWTHRAQALIDNVPLEHRGKMRQKLEQDCLDLLPTAKKDKITLQFVYFSSKRPIKEIFPCSANFYYEGCMGPVHGMQYSPFQRHLFVVCSSDGSLRLYHKLRRKPLLQIEAPCRTYLYAVRWSPVRPMVFAVIAGSGTLYVFDLRQDQVRPVVQEKVSEEAELFSMSWNRKTPNLIAVGTGRGCAKVVEISENLTTPVALEAERLNTFAAAALEEGR